MMHYNSANAIVAIFATNVLSICEEKIFSQLPKKMHAHAYLSKK